MHSFAAALDSLLTGWAGSLPGDLAGRRVVGSLTWAHLVITAAFLLLALLVSAAAAMLVRRRSRKRPGAAPFAHHLARAISKPLYVLIWAYGIYFAISPLLAAAAKVRTIAALRAFLDTALDIATFFIVFWFFFRCTRVLEARLEQWAQGSSRLYDLLVPLVGRSLRIIVPVMGIILGLPLLDLPARYAGVVGKGTAILLIGTFAVVLLQAVRIFEKSLLERHDISAKDNLRARTIFTQVKVIGKSIDVVVSLLAIACMLMLFDEVRRFGASLLASAGIIGIIAGVAAQKTIANLLAGFQIALAQPLRQDDVLIVEGEWGRVEEITLTYVVVHIWDDRRLIVPLSYFIEKPFQNWTHKTSVLLGSVYVWVDYTFPLEEGRKALRDIIETHPLWDKRFWNLQVSDATERTMQLRVLATSTDSSTSWDLRCAIREKFIAYIQSHHPQCLPHVRARLEEVTA